MWAALVSHDAVAMTSTPNTARPRTNIVASSTTVIAVVAAAAALFLGPTEEYALIFPPHWVTFVATGLLLSSFLAARRAPGARTATVLGWAAAIFYLGGSGGVILDAFRAFFWATGIPAGAFDRVDWPGALARAASLLAALGAVLHAWRLGARDQRKVDAETVGRTGTVLAWATVALVIPYPLLKLVWWAQALANPTPDEHGTFPTMELLAFGAALVLVLLMVSSRTPRALGRVLVAGGWIASMALLSMGFLMVFGLLAQVTGVAEGAVPFSSDGAAMMVLCVYGTWLMLGAVVLAATLQLMDRLRRAG